MSTNEDLIERLRNRSGVQTADVNERVALMDEAADALEKVSAERDQLAAVVRETLDVARSGSVPLGVPEARHYDRLLAETRRVLQGSPSVALDRVKAEALREAADYLDSFEGPGGRQSAHDRAGRDIIRLIRDRADRIEEEGNRG